MSAVFLKLLNMSITAGWLILAVLAARLLFKRAPRWIACLLWGLVGLRLICPFSLKSVLSLIPSAEIVPADIAQSPQPAIQCGISVVNKAVNPVLQQSFAPAAGESANPLQALLPIVSLVWVLGVAAMLIYALVSFLRLRRTVAASVPAGEGVWVCDELVSPFILGLFRPRICLPSGLERETLDCVLRHEQAHLHRRDHWWKPLGFLLLAVYWFNPLCWLAYVMLCRDIEAACDEKVIRDLDRERLAAYSQALLDCGLPRRRVAACPLAFGEIGVKQRVKAVLNYKKPAFWLILTALLVCAALAVCFLTNPKEQRPKSDTSAPSIVEWHPAVKWFDCFHGDKRNWDETREITLDAFPGVVFRCNSDDLYALTDQDEKKLCTGMPIMSVYFCDLTGDGKPEICSTRSFGSGIIIKDINVFDYTSGMNYSLIDSLKYDYILNLRNGNLTVEQRRYLDNRFWEARIEAIGSLKLEEKDLQFIPEKQDASEQHAAFQAEILELDGQAMLVRPVEGSEELRSCDKLSVPTELLLTCYARVGDTVEIEYDGMIAETYPGQITQVYSIRFVDKKLKTDDRSGTTKEGLMRTKKESEGGLFSFLKLLVGAAKRSYSREPLTEADFQNMNDEELYEAVQERTVDLLLDRDPQVLEALPEPVLSFAVVNDFLIEWDDGGLAQYLCSQPQPEDLADLPECLTRIGAGAHRALLEFFLAKNHIDGTNLSGFTWERLEDLERQYNFDAFDDAFQSLPELRFLLAAYVRANAAAFCEA